MKPRMAGVRSPRRNPSGCGKGTRGGICRRIGRVRGGTDELLLPGSRREPECPSSQPQQLSISPSTTREARGGGCHGPICYKPHCTSSRTCTDGITRHEQKGRKARQFPLFAHEFHVSLPPVRPPVLPLPLAQDPPFPLSDDANREPAFTLAKITLILCILLSRIQDSPLIPISPLKTRGVSRAPEPYN